MVDLILVVVAVVMWFYMTANGWGPITAGVVLVVLYGIARMLVAVALAAILDASKKS